MTSNGAQERGAGQGEGQSVPPVPWEVCWLPVEALRRDATYKRLPDEAEVARLVGRYNPDLAAGLRVSRRPDGSYWVTDGGIRLEAARRLGHTHVYCYVEESTQQAEARALVPLHGGTKASSLARFKAALVAGDDPQVQAVHRIIGECGFAVDFANRAHEPTAFWAVTTALAIYRARPRGDRAAGQPTGAERLRWVLLLARDIWPEARGAGQSTILRALDGLLALYGPSGFVRADMVRKGADLDPDELVSRAYRSAHAHGRSAHVWVMQDLVKAYNKHRRDPQGRLALPVPVRGSAAALDAATDDADETSETEEDA